MAQREGGGERGGLCSHRLRGGSSLSQRRAARGTRWNTGSASSRGSAQSGLRMRRRGGGAANCERGRGPLRAGSSLEDRCSRRVCVLYRAVRNVLQLVAETLFNRECRGRAPSSHGPRKARDQSKMNESKQNLRMVHRKLLSGGPVCIADLPPFISVGASKVEFVLEERRQP